MCLYLAFKKYNDYKDKWKMIVIQVGANDACNNCLPKYKDSSSIEFWTDQVVKAILRIKEIFPKTVVYICKLIYLFFKKKKRISRTENGPCANAFIPFTVGNVKLSKTLFVDGNLRQCKDAFFKNYNLCPCGNTNGKIVTIDEAVDSKYKRDLNSLLIHIY
jgi:hypothetical protein